MSPTALEVSRQLVAAPSWRYERRMKLQGRGVVTFVHRFHQSMRVVDGVCSSQVCWGSGRGRPPVDLRDPETAGRLMQMLGEAVSVRGGFSLDYNGGTASWVVEVRVDGAAPSRVDGSSQGEALAKSLLRVWERTSPTTQGEPA